MNDFDKAVEQVLMQPKYNTLTGRLPDIKKLLTDVIVNLIQDLLERFNINTSFVLNEGSGMTAYIAFGIIGVMLAILLGAMVFFMIRRRRKHVAGTVSEIMSDIDMPLSHRDLMARSGSFAASGNYREAVRYRFVALLVYLHENGFIIIYTARTNKQIKRDLKKNHPKYSAPFDEISGTFEQAWFGRKEIDVELFDKYCEETDYLIVGGGI